MLEGFYPVESAGGQAVVTLPEHIGASNAGQVREELLLAINRGATTLIADMTATVSCDHSGADAVVRAWQRAVVSGTELRLVVTAKSVSQVLDLRGLDRLVSVYPSLKAARAARLPAAVAVLADGRPPHPAAFVAPLPGGTRAAPLAAELLEALQDAAALAGGDGTIAAASARMEEMLGYGRGELPGRLVEDLSALARETAAARQEHLRLLDAVITGLFQAGLSLQASLELPPDAARAHTEAALSVLDDIIGQVRGAAFAVALDSSHP